jgi:hypothetical protein
VLDVAGSGEVRRRLGLDRMLVPAVPRRFAYDLPDGRPAGAGDTVEPDRDRALGVLRSCLRDPVGTAELMESAIARARAQFTLERALGSLDDGPARPGVRLGLPEDR